MKHQIICVGKLKEKYLKDGINEYAKRLQTYIPLEIKEVADEMVLADAADAIIEKAKDTEAERILKHIDDDTFVVTLELNGKMLDSVEFAEKLNQWHSMGKRKLAFVIGGSHGLGKDVLKRSDFRLCFGKMTYPHQLMRLILIEQIYRGVKINNNETYHK